MDKCVLGFKLTKEKEFKEILENNKCKTPAVLKAMEHFLTLEKLILKRWDMVSDFALDKIKKKTSEYSLGIDGNSLIEIIALNPKEALYIISKALSDTTTPEEVKLYEYFQTIDGLKDLPTKAAAMLFCISFYEFYCFLVAKTYQKVDMSNDVDWFAMNTAFDKKMILEIINYILRVGKDVLMKTLGTNKLLAYFTTYEALGIEQERGCYIMDCSDLLRNIFCEPIQEDRKTETKESNNNPIIDIILKRFKM